MFFIILREIVFVNKNCNFFKHYFYCVFSIYIYERNMYDNSDIDKI